MNEHTWLMRNTLGKSSTWVDAWPMLKLSLLKHWKRSHTGPWETCRLARPLGVRPGQGLIWLDAVPPPITIQRGSMPGAVGWAAWEMSTQLVTRLVGQGGFILSIFYEKILKLCRARCINPYWRLLLGRLDGQGPHRANWLSKARSMWPW